MKKQTGFIFVLLAIVPLAGLTAGLTERSFLHQCPDISACTKVVSNLLDQKYVFENDVKGSVGATANVELTKENAELLFTNLLYVNGFTRVPLGQPNMFQIMRQRDAKDSSIPIVTADQRRRPELPPVWDMFTMNYKATYPEAMLGIARLVRNMMPPNTRILVVDNPGVLLVTDFAPHLKQLYDLIRQMDVKPTPEIRRKWEEDERLFRQQARERRDGPPELPPPLPPGK